jgi:hypothetical protein
VRAVAAALLFLAVRVAIALTQESFFDELFTVWLARRPFASILSALLHDSGPPLYYFLARIPDVMGERALSIVFASVPMIWLLREKRWMAALLLAVHPAAAIFAATARPYALCGALIALAILLLERERWGWAATAMVAAAYTHFAAAFFLPLLWGADTRRRRFAVFAAVAFFPGLFLAFAQPREATAWMQRPDLAGILQPLTFLGENPSLALTLAAFALTCVAVARSRRYAAFVLLPLALCVTLSLVRPSLYPLRFASLLAFPLALWIADSLPRWGRTARIALTTAFIALGLASIATNLDTPPNDYREAATALRKNAPANTKIVATGYLYLETVDQLGEERVEAFPPEQALHPGWRAQFRAAKVPSGSFIWTGERGAPELRTIVEQRRVALLYQNARAMIFRVD